MTRNVAIEPTAVKHNPFRFQTRDIAYIALAIAFIVVCSWVTIPVFVVSFTLQILAIFLIIYVLGPVKAEISIIAFLVMGLIGLPVFSGFNAGPAVFLGPTGGFLIGFLFMPLVYLPFYMFFKNKMIPYIIAMVLALAVCYFCGTIWFILIYKAGNCPIGTALMATVVPFIPFDLAKLVLAIMIGTRVKKSITL